MMYSSYPGNPLVQACGTQDTRNRRRPRRTAEVTACVMLSAVEASTTSSVPSPASAMRARQTYETLISPKTSLIDAR